MKTLTTLVDVAKYGERALHPEFERASVKNHKPVATELEHAANADQAPGKAEQVPIKAEPELTKEIKKPARKPVTAAKRQPGKETLSANHRRLDKFYLESFLAGRENAPE